MNRFETQAPLGIKQDASPSNNPEPDGPNPQGLEESPARGASRELEQES
jgi:hypothetical protein